MNFSVNFSDYIKPYRTEAVEEALKLVRKTGKSAHPREDEEVSIIARWVGGTLDMAPSDVQDEIDAYAKALYNWMI
jgi:acetylornithine/succinyldiaminopimelate/putrescine aminotransferase